MIICACSQIKEQAEPSLIKEFSSAPMTVNLTGETVHVFDSLTVFYPTYIHLADSIVIINDIKNDGKLLHLIDMKNHQYIKGFADYGQGPGEFLFAKNVNFSQLDKPLYVFDPQLQRQYAFNFDSLLSFEGYKPTNYISTSAGKSDNPFMKNKRLMKVRQLSNGNFIAKVLPVEGGRFIIFDSDFSKKSSFGPYPHIDFGKIEEGNKELSKLMVLINMYQGIMFINEQEDKLLVAQGKLDLIEVYNINTGKKIMNITGPENNFPPEYRFIDINRVLLCEDCKFGYIYLDTTEDYILALYSGKPTGSEDAYLGNTIYQFDWNGQVICKYILDRELSSFTIDRKSNRIIGVESTALNPLVIYKIDKL